MINKDKKIENPYERDLAEKEAKARAAAGPNNNHSPKTTVESIIELCKSGCTEWFLVVGGIFLLLTIAFKVLNFVFQCTIVESASKIPQRTCLVVGLLCGIWLYNVIKSKTKLEPKWWQAILLIYVHYGLFSCIFYYSLNIINGLDFHNPEKVTYQYVVNKKSEGHTERVSHKGNSSTREVWKYYLLVKPDMDADDSQIKKIEVSRDVHWSAEVGDDWYTHTRPGLLGFEHYSKNSYIVNNHLVDRINKNSFDRDSEEYKLMSERMSLVSKSRSLQQWIKDNNFANEDMIKDEIKEIEEKIKNIEKLQKDKERALYRSLHEKK